MDAVQQLVEFEALKRLKARYFFYMDTKDWPSWLALFTPDATLHWDLAVSTRGRKGKTIGHVGIDAIEQHVVRETLADTASVHHGHTPILELVSHSDARGIWAMEDLVTGPNGPATHGYGHYHETYRKVDGEWRIASLRLTRLRLASTQL